MKICKSYPFLFLCMIILICITSVRLAGADNKIERTFALDRDGRVYLEVKTGRIEINSWNNDQVKIIAHRDADIDINHTGENIRISVTRSPSALLELFIPTRAHVRVGTTSGKVKAGEIGGSVDIMTTSGDIEVAAAGNGVRCRSVSGDIDIGEMIGIAKLKTTSGDITVERIKGSVKANTVSGNIRIRAFSHTEEMEIESISGNIKLRGELYTGGIYEINSHSGNIEMGLPSDSNFDLRVETFSGNIDCDFELKLSGKINRKEIQGIIGNGGARLSLSSFSSNIRLKKH